MLERIGNDQRIAEPGQKPVSGGSQDQEKEDGGRYSKSQRAAAPFSQRAGHPFDQRLLNRDHSLFQIGGSLAGQQGNQLPRATPAFALDCLAGALGWGFRAMAMSEVGFHGTR